jgi:hypothetical protein
MNSPLLFTTLKIKFKFISKDMLKAFYLGFNLVIYPIFLYILLLFTMLNINKITDSPCNKIFS